MSKDSSKKGKAKTKKIVVKKEKKADPVEPPVKETPIVSPPKQVMEPSIPTPTSTPPPPVKSTPDPVQSTEVDLTTDFKTVLETLSAWNTSIKGLTVDVKKLEKRVSREIKEIQKKNKKKGGSKNTDKPKRAPSGFAKPSEISIELSDFLGKDPGIHMARTEVTKYVTQYIKDHGLQNPSNKRHILPDEKLKKLLNVSNDEEVTYFNLQKFMKHHFPKSKTPVSQ